MDLRRILGNSFPSEKSSVRWYYGDKLQELCIDLILDNFDTFVQMDEIASGVLSEYFEFLKREHSDVLFDILTKRNSIKEFHLPFLINQHIRHLNLKDYHLEPEPLLTLLKVHGKKITDLKLAHKAWSQDVLIEFINCVPLVESLDFSGTMTTDYLLDAIGKKCLHLKSLDMDCFSLVTDEGISDFLGKDGQGGYRKNTTLQRMVVMSDSISSKSVALLLENAVALNVLKTDGRAASLMELYFSHSQAIAVPQYSITTLEFHFSKFRNRHKLLDVLKVYFTCCPHITVLHLSSDDLSLQVLETCSGWSKLEKVYLSCAFSPPLLWNPIKRFLGKVGPNLKHLELHQFHVKFDTLGSICPNLETLSLQGISFENDLKIKPSLLGKCYASLQKLEIEVDDNLKPVIFIISNSTSLKELKISGSNILTLEEAKMITACECYRDLRSLRLCSIRGSEAAFVELITAAVSLEKLLLEDLLLVEETDHDSVGPVQCMEVLTHLRELVWKCTEKNESFSDFSLILISRCPRLEILEVFNKYSSFDMQMLDRIKLYDCIKHLRCIHLCFDEIDADAVMEFAEMCVRLNEISMLLWDLLLSLNS